MVTIRSCFSIFVLALLLLCTVFPAAQIGWSSDIMCDSTGDTGSGHACDFSDAWEETDFEDDSPQGATDGGVISRVSVFDRESSCFLALMAETPPSTLLISRLVHPPTAHS